MTKNTHPRDAYVRRLPDRRFDGVPCGLAVALSGTFASSWLLAATFMLAGTLLPAFRFSEGRLSQRNMN